MLDIFSTTFMQKALFVGVVISLLCGLISVFVVLRKMSFIGAGISHAAFGGVAIGFLVGINPVITAVLYAIAAALGIEFVQKRQDIGRRIHRYILCKFDGPRHRANQSFQRIYDRLLRFCSGIYWPSQVKKS